MAKKVFIGVGHGGRDSGAVGYIVEKDGALVIATACKDYLQANGVEVKMSRYIDEDESLTEKINECNAYKPDLAGDIHLNAGGGDGAEVFYSINGGTGKILAQNILDEICALGQQSRGIKTRINPSTGKDYFGFIRLTNCPAVISEAYFVDNVNDVQIGDTVEEQKVMGEAIAKGFLKTLGIDSNVEVPTKPTEPTPIAYPTLRKGSRGDMVKDAQNKLIAKGYSLPKYGADGVFGNEVYDAVIALQKDAGIAVDGVIGKDTWAVLNGNFVKPNKPAYPNKLIKKGMSGSLVTQIQKRLMELGYALPKYGADGVFGVETYNAVIAFQKANGLAVDGIVGINTWNKLF